MSKKGLTDEELSYMMSVTGDLSDLDDDGEAHNEGLTGTNIDNAEMSASDEEEEDQIEKELMYDSDDDKDYVPSCSDENEEVPEDVEKEMGKKKKKRKQTGKKTRRTSTPKKKRSIVGPHPGNYPGDSIPSTSADVPSPPSPITGPNDAASHVDTTAADASLAANSSAAAPSPSVASSGGRHGRRRRQAQVDVPAIVQFDSTTLAGKYGFRWCTRPQSSTNRVARNIVTGNLGPNAEARACDSPEKCFNLFIDDSFLDIVCQWTNKRIEIEASRYTKKTATHRSVEREELLVFIGVLIFSGCQKDGHMSTCDMWSADIGVPLYRAAMSQARFEFILNCLRFDDPQTRETRRETDKFAPCRELFDNIMEKCQRHYTPCEHLCIDEQLLAFRGRCPFRMYIPSKPAKYGMKMILINDCKTKYLLGCMPYLGKDQTRLTPGIGLGHYFTKELTQPYHHTNRNVTTDNWFTSVGLVTDLLENCGMTMVGTLKANKRELPDKIKSKEDREPGSSAFLFTKEMTLVSYLPPVRNKAKKLVLLLSSMHSQPTIGEKGKPEIIEFYNSTKGGVDAFDEMCELYSCNRKTKRWPLCIFYWMVNVAVINANVVYTANLERTGGTKVPKRRRFRLHLARTFIRPWAQKRLSADTLPRPLKTRISTVCNLPSVANTQYPTGQVLAQCTYRQVRCAECPRSTDRKTRIRCLKCQRPVCQSHYYPTCTKCIELVFQGNEPSTSTVAQNTEDTATGSSPEGEQEVSIMERADTVGPSTSTSVRVNRKRRQDAMAEEAYDIMKTLRQGYESRDEYHHFGELIACKIRALSCHHARNTVQNIIQNTLYNAEQGMHDKPTPTTQQQYMN